MRTDCYNCSERLRDVDIKLEHKWLNLRSSSSRQLSDGGAAAGRLQKLDVQLTRKVGDGCVTPCGQCAFVGGGGEVINVLMGLMC